MRVAVVSRTLAKAGAAGGARSLPARVGDHMLLAHLGRGGMAHLYVARNERTGALVALKEAAPPEAERQARLLEEARLGMAVRHRGVVRTHGVVYDGPVPLLVMEYVEALDLRELMGLATRRRVRPPMRIRLAILLALLEALEAVARARGADGERLGLVHRDLSPSNVLVGFDGSIKLCDFGIAVAAGRGRADPERVEGKAAYMAPEQARGEPFDRRADIYGAGVLAWELLSGRRMRRAASRQELIDCAAAGRVPALLLHGLPDEPKLHRIVRRALAPHPRGRYRGAKAMRRALETYAVRADLRAGPEELAAWLARHFGDERARRLARLRDSEEPTASGIRLVGRRRVPSPRPLAGLAAGAFVAGSALLWLLDGLGAW